MITNNTAFFENQLRFDNKKLFIKNNKTQTTQPTNTLEDLVRARLKIAIVTETWPPEINGVALSLLQLCKGLQQQGHKILLIRPEQKLTCNEFKPNKECLVKSQSIPKYRHLQFGWPQLIKISQSIEEFFPDVVHIVTEGPLGLGVLSVAKSKGIPISSGFHSSFQDFSRFFDLAFLLKPIQKYLRWFHNNTDITCVPSIDTEKSLRNFGVKSPLVVVGRGVDTQKFSNMHYAEKLRKRWNADKDTTVLLSVGRLSPEKEIDVAIQAFLQLKSKAERKVKLVIVGDGPDKAKLQALSQDRDIIFTGSLIGQDLAEVYASADLFVFPSQVETFGNVVLEAMASGLAIIAYDYACAKKYVSHGTMGWLVGLGDSDELIRTLQNVPNRSALKEMGIQARLSVENIGWSHPVHQFEQALYRVVKETQMTS